MFQVIKSEYNLRVYNSGSVHRQIVKKKRRKKKEDGTVYFKHFNFQAISQVNIVHYSCSAYRQIVEEDNNICDLVKRK